jgi:hypothetical protein
MLAPWAARKVLAKEFSVDYATYDLAHYPPSTRGMYLHYVLFFRELVERYSHEDVAKLNRLADIAKLPDRPVFQLSQYPSVTFFLGVFATLFITAITKSPRWEQIAVAVLTLNLTLLGLGVAVVPIWHNIISSPQYQHQILQRFLQWAERDLGEEKPPAGMELTC